MQRGLSTYGWTAAEGELLHAERERRVAAGTDGGAMDHSISVRYAYSAPDSRGALVDLLGGQYDVDTGDRRMGWGSGIGSEGKTRDAARNAPAVTVYFDPARPEDSVLRRGISYGTGWLLVVLGWLCGTGLGLVRAARAPREKGATHPLTSVLGLASLVAVAAPTLLGSLTIVTERWLHTLPATGWAIGLSVAGLLMIAWPEVLQLRPVRTALGLAAPVLALTVLTGAVCLLLDLREGEPRPSWTPSEEETVARLSHPNARVREQACRTIGRAGRPVPPAERVAALVADADPAVADAAMFLVKETGVAHPEIAAALAARLRDDDEAVRQTAAWRLAGQQDADPEEAIEGAFALLRGGETSQRAGLTLLTQIGRGRRDAAEAVAAIVRDPSAPARGQAIWTLEVMKADQDVALDAVLAVLAEGGEKLRRPAVHYLATVGRPARSIPPAALDAITLDLGHGRLRRRRDAVRALARLGPVAVAARADLGAITTEDGDKLMRYLATQALEAIGDGRR